MTDDRASQDDVADVFKRWFSQVTPERIREKMGDVNTGGLTLERSLGVAATYLSLCSAERQEAVATSMLRHSKQMRCLTWVLILSAFVQIALALVMLLR